jgi:threonine/homoserine/homoserine lactone efflux protein
MLFVVSTCGSPGPNNFMIMSSGMNYGWRRSIRHLIGINTGFPVMVIAVGLGLGGILHTYPVFYSLLRPVGVAYLLYLAWRIASAPVDVDTERLGRPMSVLQAALFQWVNPKAWTMVVGAVVTYATASGSYLIEMLIIALAFMILGTPCTGSWLWLGVSLKRILPGPRQLRVFNVVMAILLVVSILPVIWEIYRSLTS